MPAKVETQQDFYIGTVERPDPRITEERIHQKLGDIHKNKPKRLTEEEKEIIRRWNEWNLKDIPEDWQTKFQNFLQISNELIEWKKVFKDLKPAEVKAEYDKPKEQHTTQDLKPINLPANWQEQINSIKQLTEQIKELSKRPTTEQLNNAVKQATEKYKDYDEIKNNLTKLKNDLNNFLGGYEVKTLEDLKKYIENLKTNPILTKEQQEAVNNYQKLKEQIELWKKNLGELTPEQVKKLIEELRAKPSRELNEAEKEAINNYDKVKGELSKWAELNKDDFKDKTAKEVKELYDKLKERLNKAINNLLKEQQKNKEFKEINKKLAEQLGSPMVRFIENKLKEVIIADEYERPYLIRTLENILTWRNEPDKERRKALFKYYNAIKKNISFLKGRLSTTQKQALSYSRQ